VIELNFKQYMEQNTVGYHNDGPGSGFRQSGGSYLTSDQTGSETWGNTFGHPLTLPSYDFALPSVVPTIKKSGKIKFIQDKENPIIIMLDNGTRLYLTVDEYRRIKGKPEIGKDMTVVFQRHQNDRTNNPSQVQSITVQ
jgi:hypothetical protein